MPNIFDNIETKLLPALVEGISLSRRADFCVGYFNLRGWRHLDQHVDRFAGGGDCCRLLIGMQRLPQDELRDALTTAGSMEQLDNATAHRLRTRMAAELREQLTIGAPTNDDEAGLRRLAKQLRSKKLVVKLFLEHPLHAKLYLLHRDDKVTPVFGYLGSSNLTFSGLVHQGELNVDVLDQDAAKKLAKWFEDRWNEQFSVDISDQLADIIEQSWVRPDLLPYLIYLKIAYHLSEEARDGLRDFEIPAIFNNKLFEFQKAAVKIAAHHLSRRDGVLIGDVVGLGKTLVATAIARIFEDVHSIEALIICPKNLVKMWEGYREQYGLRGKVLSLSRVTSELPELRRYKLVIIDESHNLRNREGKRYGAIREYMQKNESGCVLLSATPYNKSYIDLSSQLRLFIPEGTDLGVRPEKCIKELGGETGFLREHQCPVHSLAAFEKSPHPDDWRDLMRLYMVRRTRTFIEQHYAETDEQGRKYLTFENGERQYFPKRIPRTRKFDLDESDATDQYARLFTDAVVDRINHLRLPRYGLANYVVNRPTKPPTEAQNRVLAGLSRAGKRLMGFCRTNLFKRLESSGAAFLQSVERHILRNLIVVHAYDKGLDVPIGTQDAEMLDSRFSDEDDDQQDLFERDDDTEDPVEPQQQKPASKTLAAFQALAQTAYNRYATEKKRRFKWLPQSLFKKDLREHLFEDAESLLALLKEAGEWDPKRDNKLKDIIDLLAKKHPKEKVLIFSQFADSVNYLVDQLEEAGVTAIAGATGASADPTGLAWRFSPVSNEKRNKVDPQDELRVLIATDVLSEGQNLQDAAIVVNFDLPWAIIRLIQRAGRVDRIGQKSEKILCYSYLPAEGIERIISLRRRVRQRLHDNAEVVGSDEAFFEGTDSHTRILDLYNEKSGILDDNEDGEVDLASYAYQIWHDATKDNKELAKQVESLQPVSYSTKAVGSSGNPEEGVLVYSRTNHGTDALAYVNIMGQSVTESQLEILKLAACKPDTPALPRHPTHHNLVEQTVTALVKKETLVGGQLGSTRGARFRVYERLKNIAERQRGTLFQNPELEKAIEDVYRYPLRELAKDALNRKFKAGVTDEDLVALVLELRGEGRLCQITEEHERHFARIICSLGLAKPQGK